MHHLAVESTARLLPTRKKKKTEKYDPFSNWDCPTGNPVIRMDFTWAVSSVSLISLFATAFERSHGIQTIGIHVTIVFRWTLVNVWNKINITAPSQGPHFKKKQHGDDNKVGVCENITRLTGTQSVQKKIVRISRDNTFITLDFTWAVSSVSSISFLASAIVRSYGICTGGIHVTLAFRWTLVNVWNQMNITKRTRGLHFQTFIPNKTTWRRPTGRRAKTSRDKWARKQCLTKLSASVAIIPWLDWNLPEQFLPSPLYPFLHVQL